MKVSLETFTVDELENAIDSLETLASFLDRDDPLKWKWVAISAQHALYSICVTCLHTFQPSTVISSRNKKDDTGHLCQFGNGPWMKSSKDVIDNGPAYRIVWKPATENIPNFKPPEHPAKQQCKNYKLIGFWTALARVQDSYLWMGKTTVGKALILADDEIRELVWLNKQVRNELTHFIPKTYIVSIRGIKTATLTAVKAFEFLALESYTVFLPSKGNPRDRIQCAVKSIREKIS